MKKLSSVFIVALISSLALAQSPASLQTAQLNLAGNGTVSQSRAVPVLALIKAVILGQMTFRVAAIVARAHVQSHWRRMALEAAANMVIGGAAAHVTRSYLESRGFHVPPRPFWVPGKFEAAWNVLAASAHAR